MWKECLNVQQLIISSYIHHKITEKQSLRLFLFAVCSTTVAIGSDKIESMIIE